jgi:hypothetical protein
MMGPLIRRSIPLAAILAAAVALSGCFTSDYDISTQAKPETPFAAGTYKSKTGKVQVVTLSDGVYTAVASGDGGKPERAYLRFFHFPEFNSYVVQAWEDPQEGKKISYVYFYASVAGNTFTFMACPYGRLPPNLQTLVTHDVDTILRDGPRDTLYLVREVGRRSIKLDVADVYTLQ